MQISLSPEHEKFMREKISSGRYADASEVVAEALEAIRQD